MLVYANHRGKAPKIKRIFADILLNRLKNADFCDFGNLFFCKIKAARIDLRNLFEQ